MQELEHFRVVKKSDSTNGVVACLVIPDGDKEIEIPGRVLDRIYRLENGFFLAMLTDDSPYEETLYVILMDSQYRILDRVDIYQAYTGGVLSNVTIKGKYVLQFTFLDQTFQLNIKPSAEFRPSRAFSTSPIHYPSRLQKTYLAISINKNQENRMMVSDLKTE